MENRSGLLVGACLTWADGHAERVAALPLIESHAGRPRAITLGADKSSTLLRLPGRISSVQQALSGPTRWAEPSLSAKL